MPKVPEAVAGEDQGALFGSNVAPRRRMKLKGRDWQCVECGTLNKGFLGNCANCLRKK